MNLTTDLMRYHKRINNWAKLGIIAVAALIAAPVVFVIIKGIVGLAVAALLGGTVIMVAPALSMRIANTRLALKKREAMRAPIETMQNQHAVATRRHEAQKQAVNDYAGELEVFRGRAEEFKKRHPDQAAVMDARVKLFDDGLTARRAKLAALKAALDEAEKVIADMESYYEMALATERMDMASQQASVSQYEERVITSAAVDEVRRRLGAAVASIETDTSTPVQQPQALSGDMPQFSVPALETKVEVPR